jgi:predicted porin
MNKKLLAIAVGAAMVAGTTVAMAEATVYGKISMGVVSYDDGDDAPADGAGIGVFDESSRLGVKGSEDLGNGLKGVFKMEGTVDMDGLGSFDFNRDTYVGLAGDFGEVTIGRRNTSYKDATGDMDLFADMWGDVTGSGFGHFDQREANMISYKGNFGMVSLSVDLQNSEQPDTGADQDKMGNSIAVAIKPMKGLKISVANATCGGVCASGGVDDTATKLGVQWKGGDHTVNATYAMESDDSADEDMTVAVVQYGLAMGMNKIQASYSMLDEKDVDDANATQASVAFLHSFSKSTTAYVAYSQVSNDDTVSYEGRMGDSLDGFDNTTGGSTATGFAVGVVHKF